MSDKKFKRAEIIFCIIACILGVFFHFVYEWSGKNPASALFFPVNESTWEHLKLIYFPILFLALPEYVILSPPHRKRFWSAKLISVITGMSLTVILFYTYTGVYGKNIDILNIIIYFVSMITAYLLSYKMILSDKKISPSNTVSFLYFLLFISIFAVFTFFPPDIGLFQNPAGS